LIGTEAVRASDILNSQFANEQATNIAGQAAAAQFDSGDQQY